MGCCGNTDYREVAPPAGIRRFCLLCKALWVIKHRKRPGGDPCVVVPAHIIRKPDPCIYSQFMLMQLGQPVTWDNPDVRIFLGGAEQYTYNLTVSTNYDLEITIHNSSRDKAALGTQVAIRWVEFGAGGQIRHPIANLVTDVPIWPGTSVLHAPWTTPDVEGHYCIEVELTHPNDGNPANNRGWNNTQVYAANSPVERPIRIFNQYPRECPPVREDDGPVLRPHRVLIGWGLIGALGSLPLIHFGRHEFAGQPLLYRLLMLLAAGYLLGVALGFFFESAYAAIARQRNKQRDRPRKPERIDCHLVEVTVDSYEFEDKIGKDFDPETAFKGESPTWPAVIDPPMFVFQPGEAFRDVTLKVDAPDDPGPPGQFNVNVRQGGVPTGGVTVVITRGG